MKKYLYLLWYLIPLFISLCIGLILFSSDIMNPTSLAGYGFMGLELVLYALLLIVGFGGTWLIISTFREDGDLDYCFEEDND